MRLGSSTVSSFRLGTATPSRVYLGATEVWPLGASITFTPGTYTRGSAGSAPTIQNTDIVATGTTAPYFVDYLTVTNGTTPSQADMDAGSGTGVLEKVTSGSFASIAALATPASVDLGVSVTNGRIYQQVRDSSGTPVLSALTSTPVADTITYDAVAPVFSSAVVEESAPSDVVITISKDFYGTPDPSDFTLTGFTVSTATRTNATTITLGLSTNVSSSDDLTGDLSYTGTNLVGIDAEVLPTFASQNVTNNVTGTTWDITAGNSQATINTAPTAPAAPTVDSTGNGQVTLS